MEQYFLVQYLAKNHIPYSSVHLSNLPVTSASTAVTNGQVAAAVISQPLTALDQATGKIRVLATGAGYLQVLGYLTASNAALANPQKAAALQDFIKRFYTASATLRKNPELAAETYVKTYGVTLRGRQGGRGLGPGRRDPDHAIGHQLPADRGQHLPEARPDTHSKLNVKSIFDLPFNKVVAKNSTPDVVTVDVTRTRAGGAVSSDPVGLAPVPPGAGALRGWRQAVWSASPSATAGTVPAALAGDPPAVPVSIFVAWWILTATNVIPPTTCRPRLPPGTRSCSCCCTRTCSATSGSPSGAPSWDSPSVRGWD